MITFPSFAQLTAASFSTCNFKESLNPLCPSAALQKPPNPTNHPLTPLQFGLGTHPLFRPLLLTTLSAHLSSPAFQFWLTHSSHLTSPSGLYSTGGSRHAIKLIRTLFTLTGLTSTVSTICSVSTLAEQRELWPKLRNVLLSRWLFKAICASEWWAWRAGGVPKEQRDMIVEDYLAEHKLPESAGKTVAGKAVWEYISNTFDPAVRDTLLSSENYFYHLCLQGRFSRSCHPRYLGGKAYKKLSKPGAFDGVRIHTDALMEVASRMSSGSVSIVVVMDSMDWFDPKGSEVRGQVEGLWRVLKSRGRFLLRSAGVRPWYISVFEEEGFKSECVGRRVGGRCIDR